jgi:catechol 2,3-dioxygenase-like lactoylglutathione lyase family enzyme
MTPRGLDHIVHAVRNLDAAADLYRRMGFTVGARNQHPWGTQNHVVQLPGFFIELLTVAEPEKLGHDTISTHFGRFNQTFLQKEQGFSLLILESQDAAKDAEEFARTGFGLGTAARFERAGRRPDGSEVKVAFSLAFARDPRAPDCGFAVCQQHFPENFWNPAFQQHRNAVTGVAGAVLVADNPSDHHIFLSALSGERELLSTSSGIKVATPRGDIQVMDRSAYSNHFGAVPPDVTKGARLAALRVTTSDMSKVREALSEGRLPLREEHGRLVIGPEQTLGAAIAFETANPA